jgi:hypothetical protein
LSVISQKVVPPLSLSACSIAPSIWAPLEAELDRWAASGVCAAFWWRDDDAVAPSAPLDRLLALAGDTPLALAVIPATASAALAQRLATARTVTVLQHGVAHTNHAAPPAKKAELVADRPAQAMALALADARWRLAALFGPQFRPVLVPPWNRITDHLVPLLPDAGFVGLSTAGPHRAAEAAPGLRQVNCHADPIDWHGTRRCRAPVDILADLTRHLAGRRRGTVDAEEPTGLLTHHLLDDPASERFVADLVTLVDAHPAARWVAAPEIWPA